MMLALILVAGAVVTWAARVAFIAVVPAEVLPTRVTNALTVATPAVLAAVAVSSALKVQDGDATTVLGLVVPLAVAALLARLHGNLAIVVLGALLAGTLVRILGW
jgi:branched-subunit amino acid transport protein